MLIYAEYLRLTFCDATIYWSKFSTGLLYTIRDKNRIDLYRNHSDYLSGNDADPTELDGLIKIWGPLLEIIFHDNGKVKCKWGESIAYSNDYKVDCRLIYKVNDEYVDMSNLEAARYLTSKKTADDHVKLIIESKDILDHIINNSDCFKKNISVPLIQICRNQCDVTKIYLADNGLYCVSSYLNLTLPPNASSFGEMATEWFKDLFQLKEHVFSLSKYFNTQRSNQTYDKHFKRPSKEKKTVNYKEWTRGSFYPPLNIGDPIYIPGNLFGPAPSMMAAS